MSTTCSLPSGGICPGGLCSGGSLSRGSLSRGSLFRGSLCPGGSLSSGSLSREVSLPRGGSLSRGVSVRETPFSLCAQTDACENIILPQTLFAGGNNISTIVYILIATYMCMQFLMGPQSESWIHPLISCCSQFSFTIFVGVHIMDMKIDLSCCILFAADFICQTGYFPVHSTDEQGMQSIDCQSGAPPPRLTAGLLTLMMITGQMILGLLMTN